MEKYICAKAGKCSNMVCPHRAPHIKVEPCSLQCGIWSDKYPTQTVGCILEEEYIIKEF